MVVGSNPVAVTSPSDFAPASSKEFLDIQATIECGFTLKRVRDMIKTYSQVDVYLNEPIKIVEQIKLANQLIQRRTRDRNGKDNNNSYFESKK